MKRTTHGTIYCARSVKMENRWKTKGEEKNFRNGAMVEKNNSRGKTGNNQQQVKQN